jgi:hypothetical protein
MPWRASVAAGGGDWQAARNVWVGRYWSTHQLLDAPKHRVQSTGKWFIVYRSIIVTGGQVLTVMNCLMLLRAGVAQSVQWLGYGLDYGGSILRKGWDFFFSLPPRSDRLWRLLQWVPGALSPRVKGPDREASNCLPSSADVKRYLIKHRDNFTLTFPRAPSSWVPTLL